MFIELVDVLRCLSPHEDTWLVAAPRRMDGREIVDGVLGCPLCRAEYAIVGGVADFGSPGSAAARDARDVAAAGEDAEEALRLAAFLALDDVGGFVVLAGAWGAQAAALRALVPVQLLLLNPAAGVPIGPGVSGLRSDGRLPLAAASARGVALDAAHAAAPVVEDAVRVLRSRGRLVAPARVAVPAGVTELARDGRLWVAERAAAPSVPVRLTLARGR